MKNLNNFSFFKLRGWFLVFLSSAVYLPFMVFRVLRVAGDDKVYTSQAVEMMRNGTWFFQTIFDEPNYYKGPLHYWFLMIGKALFGWSMFSTVYMHYVLVTLGALALYQLGKRLRPDRTDLSVMMGSFFILNVGVFSHSFASQMESSLAGLFAIVIYFMYRAPHSTKYMLLLWVTVGVAGWLKSPLHSAFGGVSALLYFSWIKDRKKIFSSKALWLSILAGVLVGIAPYLPILIYDWDSFYQTYLRRETLDKGTTGQPWHYPILPTYFYSTLPYLFLVLWSYFLILKNSKTFFSRSEAKLGASLLLPSLLFFLYHPYRGQNYHLPMISGLILLSYSSLVWFYSTSMEKVFRWCFRALSILLMVVPFFWVHLYFHFPKEQLFWSSIFNFWILLCFSLSLLLMFFYATKDRKIFFDRLGVAFIPLYLAVGSLMVILGEKEMKDLYSYVSTHPEKRLTYYNLQRNIWSEYGYLNFTLGKPVYGIHSEESLMNEVEKNSSIMIPGDPFIDDFKSFMEKHYPEKTYTLVPWKKWLTKGVGPHGKKRHIEAYLEKDLHVLERTFVIVDF